MIDRRRRRQIAREPFERRLRRPIQTPGWTGSRPRPTRRNRIVAARRPRIAIPKSGEREDHSGGAIVWVGEDRTVEREKRRYLIGFLAGGVECYVVGYPRIPANPRDRSAIPLRH